MAHMMEHQADPNKNLPGYLAGNDYATPHSSQFSRTHHAHAELLGCMNCTYLSTTGAAPTLLALKQHAQSLAFLISLLRPTFEFGQVGPTDEGSSAEAVAGKLEQNAAFDWLADLGSGKRYENDDPAHHLPLSFLLNDVKARDDVHGTEYHCPLAQFPAATRQVGEPLHPYANHHGLVMHANACLERLDHEYAATGGLLSLLPAAASNADADADADTDAARNSLLGQWLLHTQQSVGRMHELELAYGAALDALRGRAEAPHQHLSALGPDGRSAGREIAFPQDRWVLANAGDDVFDLVHGMLDRKEATLQEKERAWRRAGLSGERMWFGQRAGDVYARGLVAVEVRSRFYRLAGQGRGTVFVIPAWERHPGTAHTVRLEGRRETRRDWRPTVVSSVQPKFPVRATELERRYEERLERAEQLETELNEMREIADSQARELATVKLHLERETAANAALQAQLCGRIDRATAERQNSPETEVDG